VLPVADPMALSSALVKEMRPSEHTEAHTSYFCSSLLHLLNLEELSIKSLSDDLCEKSVFCWEMFSQPHSFMRVFLTLLLSGSTEILHFDSIVLLLYFC